MQKICVGWGKEGTNTEGKNCCPPIGIMKHNIDKYIYIYVYIYIMFCFSKNVLLNDWQHMPWEFKCSLVKKEWVNFAEMLGGSVWMCEKAAQQNLCEKGGVPEAQPILCMMFVKKEIWTFTKCRQEPLWTMACVFLMLWIPLEKAYTSGKKVGSTACAHDNTCVAQKCCVGWGLCFGIWPLAKGPLWHGLWPKGCYIKEGWWLHWSLTKGPLWLRFWHVYSI